MPPRDAVTMEKTVHRWHSQHQASDKTTAYIESGLHTYPHCAIDPWRTTGPSREQEAELTYQSQTTSKKWRWTSSEYAASRAVEEAREAPWLSFLLPSVKSGDFVVGLEW